MPELILDARRDERALMIDTHADTPQRFVDEGWDFTGALANGRSCGHINLETARAGGVGAEFFVAWVDPSQYRPEQYVSRTMALLESVKEQVRRHPAELALCTSAAEIEEAHAGGKFGMLMAIEGGHSIANSLDLLRRYFEMGVRYMTLTWANSNDWAESSGEPREQGAAVAPGLSGFGREVIAEMNRLGMMIDVSHASDRTVEGVLACTRAPVIASHSSCRALCDSHRNLTDEQLRAIAQNGGAVMVNFYSAFVDEAYREASNAMKPERERAHERLAAEYGSAGAIPFAVSNRVDAEFAARLPRPSVAALMAHFEHAIEVAGIDHVGIGTDFDGISALPEGIDSAADLGKIPAWLRARGYSEEDVRKVLGGNLLRVFRAAQACAAG